MRFQTKVTTTQKSTIMNRVFVPIIMRDTFYEDPFFQGYWADLDKEMGAALGLEPPKEGGWADDIFKQMKVGIYFLVFLSIKKLALDTRGSLMHTNKTYYDIKCVFLLITMKSSIEVDFFTNFLKKVTTPPHTYLSAKYKIIQNNCI